MSFLRSHSTNLGSEYQYLKIAVGTGKSGDNVLSGIIEVGGLKSDVGVRDPGQDTDFRHLTSDLQD